MPYTLILQKPNMFKPQIITREQMHYMGARERKLYTVDNCCGSACRKCLPYILFLIRIQWEPNIAPACHQQINNIKSSDVAKDIRPWIWKSNCIQKAEIIKNSPTQSALDNTLTYYLLKNRQHSAHQTLIIGEQIKMKNANNVGKLTGALGKLTGRLLGSSQKL